METAIEADALDVVEEGDSIEVVTEPDDFEAVKAALEGKDFAVASAEIAMVPQTTVELTGKDVESMVKLMEGLEDHDDVKQVFANFDISEEAMIEAAG